MPEQPDLEAQQIRWDEQHSRRCACPCAAACLLYFTTFFFLLGVGALITFLLLQPLSPEVLLTSASVSLFNNLSSSTPTASWEIGFSISNPNERLRVSYQNLNASVIHRSRVVAWSMVPGFNQSAGDLATLRARFDAHVGRRTLRGWRNRRVKFGLKFDGPVKFQFWKFQRTSRNMTAWCEKVSVQFSGNKTIESSWNAARRCHVRS